MRILLLLAVLSSATSLPVVRPAETAAAELPGIALPIEFSMEPQQQRPQLPPGYQGSYTRVTPPTTVTPPRRCGTIATDVCEAAVTVPPGATGEQVYEMGKQAAASGRKGEALGYAHRSAEMGYAPAEGAYGMALLTGKGAMRDPPNGVYWLEKAASEGSRGAALELGMAFEDGQGVQADPTKAIVYLKAAAGQHQSMAEYRLGLDYEIGRGVSHNRATALEYLRRAAADGQQMAGTTANFLSKSREPQFHSIEEIDLAMTPDTPKLSAGQRNSRCYDSYYPTTLTYSQYCTSHPLCPYTLNKVAYTCPAAPF